MKIYQPPYTLTSEIVSLVAAISEQVGRLSMLPDEFPKTESASISLTEFGAFAGWEAWALWPQK